MTATEKKILDPYTNSTLRFFHCAEIGSVEELKNFPPLPADIDELIGRKDWLVEAQFEGWSEDQPHVFELRYLDAEAVRSGRMDIACVFKRDGRTPIHGLLCCAAGEYGDGDANWLVVRAHVPGLKGCEIQQGNRLDLASCSIRFDLRKGIPSNP